MKKRLCALLLAAALVTSFGAGCNNSGDTAVNTQTRTVMKVDEKIIYNSGGDLIDVTDPDKPVFLNLKQDPEESSVNSSSDVKQAEPLPKGVYLENHRSVNYGKEGLSTYGDEVGIYHYDMTDPQAVIKETLYDSGSWKSEVSKKLDDSISDEDAEYISDLFMLRCTDWSDGGDGYVYFYYVNDREVFMEYAQLNYVVGRFAKDGKGGVEIMSDDIRANDIAVKDGYIYYADTGYAWDGKKITADRNRIGIYRVKTDGSDKQQLVSVKPWGKDDSYILSHSALHLNIIGNDLYYIAQDGGEESYLYKLSLSGGAPVKVVNGSVSGYWVDTNSNTLFYYDGVAGVLKSNGSILYSMPLSGGEPKAMFRKLSASPYAQDFFVVGDYLYISDINRFRGYQMLEDASKYEEGRPAGQRYNLKTREMEYLRSYCIVKYAKETDVFGLRKMTEIGPHNIEWVKYENCPVEDGLTAYV